MSKKLIFYRLRADVPEGAANVSGAHTVKEKIALTMAFAEGRVNPLYCHAASVTGWQLPEMYDDEYSIEFVGNGWSELELLRGRARIRRRRA